MPDLTPSVDIYISASIETDTSVHVSGTETPLSALQVSIADDLSVGASANYIPESRMLESLFYIQDAQDLLQPSKIVEDATAELLFNGQVVTYVTFRAENANIDGAIRLFFLNPPATTDLSIRFSATIEGAGWQQFTVDAIHERVYQAPLGAAVHPQTDPRPPRTEPNTFQVYEQQLEAAPDEQVQLSDAAKPVLFSLDPSIQFDYLVEGTEINYEGGGNRVLPSTEDVTDLAVQELDVFPGDVGLKLFVESATTNLAADDFMTDTDADGLPDGLTLTVPDTAHVETTLMPLIDEEVNLLRLHARGILPFDGSPSTVILESPTFPISVLSPVALSVLARTLIHDGEIANLRLKISWRDASDVEITTTSLAFDPLDLQLQQLAQLALLVDQPSLPVGAVGARWIIELESVEGSDSIKLYLALPQLEQLDYATSPALGSRVADTLTVPQAGNLEVDEGAITVSFAPGYDGTPPSDVYFFDSRESALNGFSAKHRSDGVIEFEVYDSGGQTLSLTTDSSVSLVQGAVTTLTFSWRTSLARIHQGDTLLKESTSSYDIPTLGETLHVLSAHDGTGHLNGELTFFEIRRDAK